MRELTKAEEQIMQAIWSLGPAFVKEILAGLPDPKPAYTTVSTIVRILESKGFVDHKVYGTTHQYFALISKEEYSHYSMKKVLENYFDGSFKQMVSFFSRKENLDLKDMDELVKMIDKMRKDQL